MLVAAVIFGGGLSESNSKSNQQSAKAKQVAAPVSALSVDSWAEVLEQEPDPKVVTDADFLKRIVETKLPWRVRDMKSGMEMLLVPPGEFVMGMSPGDKTADNNEKPPHDVTISKPFYLGKTEVTQEQWVKVMQNNPSKHVLPSLVQQYRDQGMTKKEAEAKAGPDGNQSGSRNYPVNNVSWDDCQKFCNQTGLRLPTEAEWEYACRAGVREKYYGDPELISSDSTNDWGVVGRKLANALGFHDTLGSVSEWCNDFYHQDYYKTCEDGVVDPKGPSSDNPRSYRVLRDGDGHLGSGGASARSHDTPRTHAYYNVGFRAARTPLTTSPAKPPAKPPATPAAATPPAAPAATPPASETRAEQAHSATELVEMLFDGFPEKVMVAVPLEATRISGDADATIFEVPVRISMDKEKWKAWVAEAKRVLDPIAKEHGTEKWNLKQSGWVALGKHPGYGGKGKQSPSGKGKQSPKDASQRAILTRLIPKNLVEAGGGYFDGDAAWDIQLKLAPKCFDQKNVVAILDSLGGQLRWWRLSDEVWNIVDRDRIPLLDVDMKNAEGESIANKVEDWTETIHSVTRGEEDIPVFNQAAKMGRAQLQIGDNSASSPWSASFGCRMKSRHKSGMHDCLFVPGGSASFGSAGYSDDIFINPKMIFPFRFEISSVDGGEQPLPKAVVSFVQSSKKVEALSDPGETDSDAAD